MQSDPVQFSTFGHMEETVPQECLPKSFCCSKCTLIFKSKVYLFEHLNKVHCLDIDVCLRDAGLKYAESKKVNTEKSRSAGKSFTCRNCDFKTCSRDVLTKHETQCGQTESPNLNEIITTPVTTSNQHDEAEEASSSKDLRIYKRPSSQTITKYFTATSGSNVKLKLASDIKNPFSLEETPQIDVSFRPSDVFKHADHLYHSKRGGSDSQAEQTNMLISEVGRKTSNESLKAPASKKPKLEEEATENKTSKPSGSTQFSFEVSDEEEERKAKLVDRDPPRPKVYFCKHCDYSNVNSGLVSSHYASDHPYVRCNAGYIQQSSDQSATFRCLECPVEFPSTVDLKWHYTEKHPEAPDVFKMKLNELKLEFKCFTCTFTCSEVKDLRHHYKQNHRTWEVDNSLLFCQYLVKECQKTCEQTSSTEKAVALSPDRTSTPHKEVEITLSRHPPTSTGPDASLYKCIKCQFEHKSAVAMQVHYQKKHPEKLVSLDEIKQFAREMTPEKKNLQKEKSTVQIKEKDTTPKVSKGSPEHLKIENVKSLADYATKGSSPSKHIRKTTDETASSQKVKLKSAPSLPKDGKLSQSELPSKATLKTPEISVPKCVKSSKKESTTKMSLSKPNTETTKSKSDKFLCSSPLNMHYCQFCSYASPQIRSVIGHHNAKHAAQMLLSKEDIIQYSAEVIENKNPITFKTSSHVKNSNEPKTQIRKTEVSVHVDQLYFCHLCNLGNPSTQGIIAHQVKVHQYKHSSRKSVLKYSALVREKIEKNGLYSSKLPLPIIKEEDKEMFFCHYCNYKHRSLTEVAHHFSRIHCQPFNKTDIRQYTSKVLEQLQKSPLKSAANLEKPEGKKEATNMSSKTFSNSVINTETHRRLPCKYCTFTTQYVFLLMSHMRKIHFSKLSVAAVLRLCFRKGALESGYHCEWCVFSHKKAEVVHKHYQDRHPGCKQMSLATVKARLFVGIKELHSKEEKTELKSVSKGQTSQSSQKDQDRLYHCTLCTFKSNAQRYLTRHCNKFHPLLVKNSPSDKGKREKSELDDLNEMPGLFESFQVPLEDTDEETSSSNVIKCPSCPATFHSKHGLSVHTGIKHLNNRNVKKQPEQIEGHMHVYKCPYCNYFNTSHQGVLTHCQMRHPVSTSRADSLYLDMARLSDCDDFMKGNSSDEVSKFSGYMCKTCPIICATLNKLKRHREQDHNETTSDMPKPASSTPKLSLRINLAKPNRTLKSVSKTSLHTKKVYIKIKCPQCPYVCSTNLGLNSHMLKQHNNAAPKDGIHKCMLCSQTYPFKRRLAKHYVRTHGKGSFQKYYIPLYKPFQKKKESSSQQEQNNSEKRLIFKCPTCPYVNTSYHGTLTHCQMKHPSVTVRADELETGEILLSNIVRCSKGKGSYKRGYMCKSCPEIHSSIKKLINHCRNEHGKAAVSELLSEAEKPDDNEDIAEETSAQLQREDGKAAPLKIVLKKDSSYKCELCPYSALTRKNLQCHYKYFHKLDALSTYKKLEKYNKRKNNFPFRYIELKKQLNLICKKCPNSVFASSQLLIEHYNNFHHLRSKSDFTVVSFGVRKKSTGLYKCNFCRKNLHGIRYLTRHLDRHRDQMKVEASQKKLCFASGTANPPSPKESQEKKNLPTFETIAELSHWTGAPVEVVTLPSSPPPSSSKVPDVDPEAEAQEVGHPCKRCQRTFMSLKGLRSHERSHAALGAIKKLDNLINTEFKNNIKKYLLHKPETLKPYRCGCCAYRTNFMVLWQSHFLKNHQDIIEQEIIETSTKDEEISQSSDKEVLNNLPELDEEPEDVEESTESYSEPPNVQRQLTHYSLMAQNVDKTNMNLHELSLSEGNLQCEMCNFNTEHLSSIRRHYANRHGKKILRCKDCEFYTGLRKNMEMHIETGHSTCQSKPTYLKDLRCPFCLYQTKNKNNMIDHIVLHREERVMPIEVRRPKLSRYLQGIVFRCHKCTFSSGSAENLRLHMMRHDDVKPYKCRLCYFDCTRLTDLEAHLSDKHQVLRNHELVGQVSLDQLEARTGSRPEANINHGSDSDELEAEEFTPDRDDIPQTDSIPDYHSTENMMFPMKEEHEPEEQEENGKTPANSSGSDIIQQNTSVLQRHEQDTQARDQNVAFHQPAKEQHEKNTEPKAEDCSDADIKYDDCRKNQTTLTDRQDEKVARRSLTSGKITDAKADGLHFTENHCKSQSIEAMVEDDIVCHVLRLDEDGSLHKPHKRAGQERSVKMEQTTEGNGADNEINDKVCSTSLAQNLKIQNSIVNPATTKMNSPQGNTSKLREGFRFEPHLLTLSPSQTRLKLAHRGSLGSLLVNFKREQSQSPKIIKDDSEPNREKAVLEECAKEEPPHLEQCEEEKEDEQMEKTDGEVEIKKNECKVQVSPHLHDDAFAPMDGAFELLHDEKLFTCELCGRNLTNVSELNRHILRHGV